jgi:adenylate cyclase
VPDPSSEWQALLSGEAAGINIVRRRFRHVPSPPRCKLCYAPFAGIGGFVLRPWFGPWEANPQLCKTCFGTLSKAGPGGAEVAVALLFADIRGSTGLAERIGPGAFSAVLQAFYGHAVEAIERSNGIVDKFVGDEAIGLFIPGLTGPDIVARAIDAGRTLIDAVGRSGASSIGPIPVGAGVHTGIAWVGTVGPAGEIRDFTALGDPVNTTARLAQIAAAGELLVSAEATSAAGFDVTGLVPQAVEVRGREATIDVYSLPPPTGARPAAGAVP